MSVRKVEVGDLVMEAFDEHDNLILRQFDVQTENDLERLNEIGVRFCEIDTGDTGEPDKTSETSTVPIEEIIDQELDELTSRLEKTEVLYEETTEKLGEVFMKVHDGKVDQDDFQELKPYLQKFVSFVDESPASVSILTQIEDYDDVTFNHSVNVSILCMLYGRYRGFNNKDLLALAFGALVHDIGKTEVSREIVQKEGELTDQEWDIVQRHPEKGANLLRDIGMGNILPRIAHEHHERPDGNGYPEGVNSIHPFSRIVSVFDMYEALTAPRSYKDAMSPLKAFNILRDHFGEYAETRKIIRGLIRCLGIFPVGSVVELTNNLLAVVQHSRPDDLKHPRVTVISDGRRNLLDEPYPVDLQHTYNQKEIIRGELFSDDVKISSVVDLSRSDDLREQISAYFREQGFGDEILA